MDLKVLVGLGLGRGLKFQSDEEVNYISRNYAGQEDQNIELVVVESHSVCLIPPPEPHPASTVYIITLQGR